MGAIYSAIAMVLVILAGGFVMWFLLRGNPSTEMTNRDVTLYREAAKIFTQLGTPVGFYEDIISAATSKQINEWLTNYRKELKKK